MSLDDNDDSPKGEWNAPKEQKVTLSPPMSTFGFKTATQWAERWGLPNSQVTYLRRKLEKGAPAYVATNGKAKSKFKQISFAESVDRPRRDAKLLMDKNTKIIQKQLKLENAPEVLEFVEPPSQLIQSKLKAFPLSEILLHVLERASDLEKVVATIQGMSHQIHIPEAPED
jgi:hypothetical protein